MSLFARKTKRPLEASQLGAVLIKMGLINDDQLAEGLRKLQWARDNKFDMKLGDALVRTGTITESQLATALAFQKGLRNGGAVDVMVQMIEWKTDNILRRHVGDMRGAT